MFLKNKIFMPFAVGVALLPFGLAGCAASQAYYKNVHYTGNTEAYLNRDLQRCEAIARQARPNVPVYLPKGPTTTQGRFVVFDNHGNIAQGTYQSTTYPDQTENFYGALNNFAQTMNAYYIYTAVKDQCLADLGWRPISKEEYEQIQLRPKSKKEHTRSKFLEVEGEAWWQPKSNFSKDEKNKVKRKAWWEPKEAEQPDILMKPE